MTTPEVASAPSDAEKDRVWDWRIAVLSAVSALIGVLAGGVFSYLVAIHDSRAQADTDRSDFLRQQRQVVYVKFIGDTTKTGIAANKYLRAVYDAKGIQAAYDETVGDDATEAEDAVSISIIGSAQLFTAAKSIQTQYETYYGKVFHIFANNKDGTKPTDSQTRALNAIKPPTNTLAVFERAAKRDIEDR